MKYLILLLISLQSFICLAQTDCEYTADVIDSVGTYKMTNSYIIHERTFGNSQSTIFFSLINADGLPSLRVQLIQKSNDFIAAKCFDKNSKIFLQLENGKVITLIAVDDNVCGESVALDQEGSNRVLTGYFLFMKETLDILKSHPISIMRIKYASDTVDFVMKEELLSEIDKKMYHPNRYFMNYLKCID